MKALLTWLVIACLLPGGIGAGLLLLYDYRQDQQQLESSNRQIARAMMQAVDNHLFTVQALAQSLSRSDALAANDRAAFHRQARQLIALTGLGANVVLRDHTGQQVVNTALEFGAPLPTRPLSEELKEMFVSGKPSISRLFTAPVIKKPVIGVYAPVPVDGRVAYLLGIGITPDRLQALLATQRLPQGWVVGILDSANVLVSRSHHHEKYVGRHAVPELMSALSRSAEGSVRMQTFEGTPVLAMYSRSSSTGWTTAIFIPQRMMEAPLIRSLVGTAVGVASLFAIGIGFAWLISRKIAQSMQALIAPAMAIGGGTAPAPQVAVREAAEVAAAIRRAVALLDEREESLRAKNAELEQAHRLAEFGTWHWDRRSATLSTSDSIRSLYARDLPSFPQMRDTLISAGSWEQLRSAGLAAMESGKPFRLEVEIKACRDGWKWLDIQGEPVFDGNRAVTALRGTVQNITDRKLAERRIRDAALHDPLTGLPNRTLIFEYCGHMLAAAERSNRCGAILFIDIDRFKTINDVYGHEAGDRVLQEVSRRLLECSRDEDIVGRLGGDEFIVVQPHAQAHKHRAAQLARRIIDSLSRPFHIEALELSITPSIGISHFPAYARDVSTLIHTADLAMYQAKQGGRGHLHFYTPELERNAELVLSVESRLKDALRQGELTLRYQPIIHIGSGKLVGVEALVRLQDEAGVAIPPETFVSIAESVGLIEELGEMVAREACRQYAAWHKLGLHISIAVNVSPLQFRHQRFAENFRGMLMKTGLERPCMQVEVTESAIMDNVDHAVSLLNELKAMGTRISLDDFGTGYSSLSHLTSFPIDKLKIDKSFIQRIASGDAASRTVTEAIIALGHSLKLEVVAEGVESQQTLDYLSEQGCDQAQGYWISEPLPANELVRWCIEHHAL